MEVVEMMNDGIKRAPRPYYTVEALDSEWTVKAQFTLRQAAINTATEMSKLGIRHHVYLQCRNGQRKHIFVGRTGEVAK